MAGTIGDRRNTEGVMSAQCNGAVTIRRFVCPSGVDADNLPRVARAATAKSATLNSVEKILGVARTTEATLANVEYFSLPGSYMVVEAGAAVAADKDVMTDSVGRAIEATSTAGQYTQLAGRSLNAAANAGDMITIIYHPQLALPPSVGDDLAVVGNETVGGTLGVTGVATLTGALTVNGGMLATDGTIELTGGLTATTLLKGADLESTDDVTVGDALGVTGISTFTGGIVVNGGMTATDGTIELGSHMTAAASTVTAEQLTSTDDAAVAGLLTIGEFIEITEMVAPAAPAATKARLFCVDNGGKVELKVLFPTGAAIQIAIEV